MVCGEYIGVEELLGSWARRKRMVVKHAVGLRMKDVTSRIQHHKLMIEEEMDELVRTRQTPHDNIHAGLSLRFVLSVTPSFHSSRLLEIQTHRRFVRLIVVVGSVSVQPTFRALEAAARAAGVEQKKLAWQSGYESRRKVTVRADSAEVKVLKVGLEAFNIICEVQHLSGSFEFCVRACVPCLCALVGACFCCPFPPG